MAVLGEKLYVGGISGSGPCQIWAFDGGKWRKAAEDGFGDPRNFGMHAMTIHDGALYAGTFQAPPGLGSQPKCQVWRYDGSAWEVSFDNVSMGGIDAMTSFGGALFFSVFDSNYGCRIVRLEGSTWEEASEPGISDGAMSPMASAMVEFDSKLHVAVVNPGGGARKWSTTGERAVPFNDGTKANPYDGFSPNHNTAVTAVNTFNGKLYAGTENQDTGCELWSHEAGTWTKVADRGFLAGATTVAVTSSIVFDSRLFLGTTGTSAGLYAFDGAEVTAVSTDGFGNPQNSSTTAMAVFNGQLYVGATSDYGAGEVYRYEGDNTFTLLNSPGFGDPMTSVTTMAAYGPYLFVGTFHRKFGAEIWSYDGNGWTREIGAGFADLNNNGITSMAVFNDVLYMAVDNAKDGCQIWTCDQGAWKKRKTGGFNNPKNSAVTAMEVHKGKLYMATIKPLAAQKSDFGCEIWSFDGKKKWVKESKNGFGNIFNSQVGSMVSDGEHLFAGTNNLPYGAQVWATTGE